MSIPSSDEPKPRRRLVPALEGAIEAGGQRLVRVKREPLPDPAQATAEPEAPTSLESLARKHLGQEAEEVLSANAEFLEALAAPEDVEDEPSIEDVARRIELFSDTAALPSDETNPGKRPEGAVAPIFPTEDGIDFLQGKSQPETLLDLFSLYPLDGINYFIHVNRESPKLHGGVHCAGILRPVRRQLSHDEWREIYGGGVFSLIVYGPPKRGHILNAEGRVAPKKLTAPIKITFPGAPSLICTEDDEEPMIDSLSSRRGPATVGDATIRNKEIDTAANREIRLETTAREEREKADRALREKNSADNAITAQLLKNQQEATARALEREREHNEEIRKVTERFETKMEHLVEQIGAKKPDDVERVIALSKAMGTGGNLEQMRADHDRALERVVESHKREIEYQNQMMRDERSRSESLIKEERDRADRRIREIEAGAREVELKLRDNATSEIQKAKEEAERRLNDQHRMNESRLTDLDRNNQRDLAALTQQHAREVESLRGLQTMQLSTVDANQTARIEALKAELQRAQEDAKRYRKEADDNKDFMARFQQFKETAAAAGMVDERDIETPEATPEPLSQQLLRMGAGVAQSLPALLESIMSSRRTPDPAALQQARAQGQQDMIREAQNAPQLGGRTRGPARLQAMPQLTPMSQSHQEPLIHGQEPFRQTFTTTTELRPLPRVGEVAPSPLYPPQAAPVETPPAPALLLPPEPQYHPNPSPSMAPPPPPGPAPSMAPPQPAPELAVSVSGAPPTEAEIHEQDQQILSVAPLLYSFFESNAPPSEPAQMIVSSAPRDQVLAMMGMFGGPERIIQAFERLDPNHAFARREGKKFLRGVFAELKKLIG